MEKEMISAILFRIESLPEEYANVPHLDLKMPPMKEAFQSFLLVSPKQPSFFLPE
jgi:hypothetical protein